MWLKYLDISAMLESILKQQATSISSFWFVYGRICSRSVAPVLSKDRLCRFKMSSYSVFPGESITRGDPGLSSCSNDSNSGTVLCFCILSHNILRDSLPDFPDALGGRRLSFVTFSIFSNRVVKRLICIPLISSTDGFPSAQKPRFVTPGGIHVRLCLAFAPSSVLTLFSFDPCLGVVQWPIRWPN